MDQNNQPNQPQKDKKPKRPNLMWVYLTIIALLGIAYIATGDETFATVSGEKKEISYTQLQSYLQNDCVESIVIADNNTARATIRPEQATVVFGEKADKSKPGVIEVQIPSVQVFNAYVEEVNQARAEAGLPKMDVTFKKDRNIWMIILGNLFPLLFFIMMIVWMTRSIGGGAGGGIFNVG